MAAIFNLPLTPMSESVHISPVVLLDTENVGVAFGISLLTCIEAEIMRYSICFWLMAVIFDLWLTPTSHSIYISPTVFLDHENAGSLESICYLVYKLRLTFFISSSGLWRATIIIFGSNTVISLHRRDPIWMSLPFSENSIQISHPFRR